MNPVHTQAVGQPFYMAAGGSTCLAWLHAAQGQPRGISVVMCQAIGYEAMCAYGAYRQVSQALAQTGFDVLRFDYPGTGDASGSDAEGDRVPDWTASICTAAQTLTQITGHSRLALFGLRLGAQLALQAAAQMGGVERIVLWAPCKSGRAFTRELRAAATQRASRVQATPNGDILSMGFLYSAPTLSALQALPALPPPEQACAHHVLVLDRDDLPQAGPLAAHLSDRGTDTQYAVAAGYTSMMQEPRQTLMDSQSLALLSGWLASDPVAADSGVAARPRPFAPVGEHHFDGLRESAVQFGPGSDLFGVLAEPDRQAGDATTGDTAVLMLSVGGNYRVGPNRIYTRLARSLAQAGYCALRFDLPGLGDSPTPNEFSMRDLYSKDATPQVRAAIDYLSARGCRHFYLLGICSGSFVAFQSALADERVTGQVLMNSRLLDWRQANPDGQWQEAMQEPYKSSSFYRRQLLRPEVYRRLLRGEIDVRGISRRLSALLVARWQRGLRKLLAKPVPQDDVLNKVKRLSARGTSTLLLVTEDDDGRDYLEFHFGRRGSYLRDDPNFKMVLVQNSDHTFTDEPAQAFVAATLTTYLDNAHRLQKSRPLGNGLQAAGTVA
jgi:alpha-beta hydrolase superfamily lysophospholipase